MSFKWFWFAVLHLLWVFGRILLRCFAAELQNYLPTHQIHPTPPGWIDNDWLLVLVWMVPLKPDIWSSFPPSYLPEPSSRQHDRPWWTCVRPSLPFLSPDRETESWWLCGPASSSPLYRPQSAGVGRGAGIWHQNVWGRVKRSPRNCKLTSMETLPSLFLKSCSCSSSFFCSSVRTSESCGSCGGSATSWNRVNTPPKRQTFISDLIIN